MRSTRRTFVAALTSVGLLGVTPAIAKPPQGKEKMTLGFTTYGMRQLTLPKALRAIDAIGYDAVEIDTAAGQHGDPFRLSPRERKKILDQLQDSGLQLRSLMMHLTPSANEKAGQQNLDRLGRTVELAQALSPASPPSLQTVLGGGKWEEKKNLFVDRLGKWLEVVGKAKITLAIKPHRGGGMSRPREAVWLIKQLGQPHLRMVYDYSHYAHRGMPLAETIRTALSHTSHIAVKDAVLEGKRVRFDLPGRSGTFDYVPLLKQFYAGGYRGDINCEVSSQVWRQRGYEPLAAARTCYANISKAFEKAGIKR